MVKESPTDMLRNARWLVNERGVSVIPLDHPAENSRMGGKSTGKMPVVSWKAFQKTKPTDKHLKAWFSNGRPRNIGIVTGAISNLVVVDCDSQGAIAWADAHLPSTPWRTRTARGEHRGYRHPGIPVRNGAHVRTDDPVVTIDIRGDGGYVVAPGSLHQTGVTYERIGEWPCVDQLPVFDSAWLQSDKTSGRTVPAPRARPPGGRSSRGGCEPLLESARSFLATVLPAVEGQGGDEHTYRVVCRIVCDFGLMKREALSLLRDWNRRCVPPWSDVDLQTKITNAQKYGRGRLPGQVSDGAISVIATSEKFPLTDSGNAEHFAARWGRVVRFDHGRRKWFLFDGSRWMPSDTGEVDRLALEAIRARQAAALQLTDETQRKAALRWSLNTENRSRRDHLMALATKLEMIAVDGTGWDTQPMLLGVMNGVLDLETGKLRPASPTELVTKATSVAFDPAAKCPRFDLFMREIFSSTPELVDYVERCFGYALTGLTTQQAFWILWGEGANGKSTLIELIMRHVLGALDYAWTMPFPTTGWSDSMSEYHKANLVGRRFVSASEVSCQAQLNEEFVKSLTGDDTLNARHPYGRPFQFIPMAKFFLRVNQKPIIRDPSHGMWRRVKLIPFAQIFPLDKSLAAVLANEAPGILALLVRACLDYQREGLREPAIVTQATAEYQADSDPLTGFLADRCVMHQNARVGGQELYAAFRAWCEDEATPHEARLSQKAFGLRVKVRFPDLGTNRKVMYAGVGLRA